MVEEKSPCGALQPWYADDLGGVGTASDNATATMLQLLKVIGSRSAAMVRREKVFFLLDNTTYDGKRG